MDLTYRDIVEILQIVDSSGFSQLSIEDGPLRLRISRGENGQPIATGPRESGTSWSLDVPSPPVPATAPVAQPTNGETATAVMRRVNVGGLELAMSQPTQSVKVSESAIAVPSPILGVFYRCPSPDAPPYVAVGVSVAEGDTLCLVESMKMFMPVQSPIAGTVVAIAPENKALVEFNQPLIWIDPEVSA